MPPKYSRPKPIRRKGAVTLKDARRAVRNVQRTKNAQSKAARTVAEPSVLTSLQQGPNRDWA